MKFNKRFAFTVFAGLALIGLIFGVPFAYKEIQQERLAQALAQHQRFVKGDPDAPSSEQTKTDQGGEGARTPASAAEEDFANRAYPAEDIPFTLVQNAKKDFDKDRNHKEEGGKKLTGVWNLAGPSSANYPGVLAFSGKDYTASGRITALAIDSTCSEKKCRMWVGAAGGGIWRNDQALSPNGQWKFVSGPFATNAIGTLTYDAVHNTLYAGTGEPNASSDSEAGLGIYKSTNGGNSWTHLSSQVVALSSPGNGTYSGDAFAGRSISSIVVDPTNPNTLYVGSARAVRGVTSVNGGAVSNPPTPRPPFGLFKSTDGGATFSFIWNANASVRGINHVELDPLDPTRVYAAGFGVGLWRSTAGSPFEQVFVPASGQNVQRSEFSLTSTAGHTRIYVGDGAAGAPTSGLSRTDNADLPAASIVWKSLTSNDPANPYYATYNYCTGQCWYDNMVYSPPGFPDIVYLAGSFQYGEYGWMSNSRAVLLSTDGGEHFTDMSWDATSATTPNGIHPDQHALVVSPANPLVFFEGSDGGLMRSNGKFADESSLCASRGVFEPYLTACNQLLSRVPAQLTSLNKGLSTLQFQSLSVNPQNYKNVMGGTQDNGTFETTGSAKVWPQIIYGDGGQSGFNAANPTQRFNSFFGQFHDANFQNGDPTKWVIISGPIASSVEGSQFYDPIIADPNPAAAGTIFEGSQSIWRTQDWGGDQAYLEANCPEFTTSGSDPNCGDFVRIGPAGQTDLTSPSFGNRAGGFMAAIERNPSDTGTLWAATQTGRVFVSHNADAAAGDVTFTRIDSLSPAAPNRFVSSITIDPANPNHAWISYSGYSFNTPLTPGHVFEVTYDPTAGSAAWTNLDAGLGTLGDMPVTDLVRDDKTGDLYAATDFGVLRLPAATATWVVAGTGLPNVAVAGLTVVPGSRVLYAATHGRSAWLLTLP